MTRHVAVWIDHQEAKIFHVEAETFDAKSVNAPGRHLHRHPIATTDRAHSADLSHFFKDVTDALADAQEILVVGPATAKLELIKYVHAHVPALTSKIVGVETVDHPTDGQLVAHARKYFLAADRMR